MKRKIEDGTQNNQTETVPIDYLSLAESLFIDNKNNNALYIIKLALRKEPHNYRALHLHAQILIQLNKANEALEPIKIALDIAPEDDIALQLYAQVLTKLNRLDEAQAEIEKALKIAPDNTSYLQHNARLLANLNRLDEAQAEIEKALKIEPDNTSYLEQNARLLANLNRLDKAQVVIEKALKIEPDNASNLRLYQQISAKLSRILNAKHLISSNRNKEAKSALMEALKIFPNNVLILQLYVDNEVALNNYNGALVAIKQALHIEPNNDVCLLVHAQILLGLNKPKEALVEIERALGIRPDNYIHLNVFARTLTQLNRPNEALVVILKALDMKPNCFKNLQIHAEILLLLNRPNDALTEIERSLDIRPNNIYSQIVYAQILSNLNRLDYAQRVIEQTLWSSCFKEKASRIRDEISNKMKRNQSLDESINNIFISKKYFNAPLPSRANSGDDKEHTNCNRPLIKLCTFQQVKDVEQDSSPQELKPIPLNINKSNFTYYTKEPKLPSNATPCIFIMAGRQANALIPTPVPTPNRTILVITEEELNRVYLNNQKEQLSVLILPERTDLLVINHLESSAYGRYDQTTLINARRIAALCVAIHLQLNHLMLMDDNIQELNCTNGALSEFRQLWAMHQPDQLLSSIITSSNRSFNSGDKNKLGSKLFLMNAVQLQQSLNFIKPEELAFFLFLPPNCSNLIMEDYYFQLLINRGLYLNNSSLNGHVTLDEQSISLTRSSANKSAAKKSTNAFGAFAWLSLDDRAFVTDSLVEKLSANINSKELINTLVSKVVDDIKKVVTNNLRHTNEYLSECKTETLNRVTSGNKKNNKSLDKKKLWELIKKNPTLKLRQPQIDAIERWINEQSSGYLHSYSIATGVGKTFIKAIMAYLELACTDQPVIVVTADQKLVNNLTEQFTSVFGQLNTLTQLNLSSNMIIPVMSSGNRAISQGSLAASDGFKFTQNLYVFCEDSFLKLVQEQKVEVNHTSMILLDEYHCYTKTLDVAIAAVQGFIVYAGQLDKGINCYCIDVHQDCISLFDAQGTKRLLDLKPSLIFNLAQIKSMQDMATQKHPIQLNELTLLNSLQAALQQEQQKMVFPTFQHDATREIPFYWGELSATTIKLVYHLPAAMPTERITYITPTGIYQTNQTGITQCVVTQDELMDYWRDDWYIESMDEPLEAQEKNQLVQSMCDYFAAHINEDDFKHELNQLIISNDGLPCIDLDGWEQTSSPECFILTNVPPQLIYRNKNGKEQEIASGFDLYQIWGFEQMKERKSYTEQIAFNQCLDLDKFAELKQLITKKQLASFPNIIRESSTNIIGFSATPPIPNPLNCVFNYSKETAEFEGYITPSIVRRIEIKSFKNIPYKDIFTDVLTMNGPEGELLCERKGLYRFKSINELKKAEQILKDNYKDLSISAVHTPKGKEHGYNEKIILNNFSTIPYNQGAILLIVSKLQKGWDEPRLSYTVDFRKNPSINSAIQFLGRTTRVCYDRNEQQQPIANNKIGLGFFPTTATNVKKHLEPLKKPLPQNKRISLFYSSEKKGCIEAGDYNLNSMQKNS